MPFGSSTPATEQSVALGAHSVPREYTSVAEEYTALTEGVAVLDRSNVGRLSYTGEDALDLIDRLTTNEINGLEVGTGISTVLTSNKGRIVDVLIVLRLEHRLMVMTSPEHSQSVADHIGFFTFAEDVEVRDITSETAMLSIAGPGAPGLLDGLAGPRASSLGPYESRDAVIAGAEATVIRSDFLRLPAYDLVVPDEDRERLWSALLEGGEGAAATPVGLEALESVRVEKGLPAFGKELGEAYNPLEANLISLVSFTKGCYVGQEVVTRLNTYDKVQKRLVRLRWKSDIDPAPNAKLVLDEKQVGIVTSATRSPLDGAAIGLGYVRKAHARTGAVLGIELAGETIPVEVVELPGQAALA